MHSLSGRPPLQSIVERCSCYNQWIFGQSVNSSQSPIGGFIIMCFHRFSLQYLPYFCRCPLSGVFDRHFDKSIVQLVTILCDLPTTTTTHGRLYLNWNALMPRPLLMCGEYEKRECVHIYKSTLYIVTLPCPLLAHELYIINGTQTSISFDGKSLSLPRILLLCYSMLEWNAMCVWCGCHAMRSKSISIEWRTEKKRKRKTMRTSHEGTPWNSLRSDGLIIFDAVEIPLHRILLCWQLSAV